MQVVINTSHSNFAISRDAILYAFDNDRCNPLLVEAVEKLGKKADGLYTTLKIVEIPNDVSWKIMFDTSGEYIAEAHRTWR
jgi:hypothetical protein